MTCCLPPVKSNPTIKEIPGQCCGMYVRLIAGTLGATCLVVGLGVVTFVSVRGCFQGISPTSFGCSFIGLGGATAGLGVCVLSAFQSQRVCYPRLLAIYTFSILLIGVLALAKVPLIPLAWIGLSVNLLTFSGIFYAFAPKNNKSLA